MPAVITRARMRRRVAHVAAALALAAPMASANGRFPSAQQVVIGPGPTRSDVIALRVTFGVALSTDGGRSFRWICEEGMYFPYVPRMDYDPAVELDARGAVVFSYESGVRYTTDGCATVDVAGTEWRLFYDLTGDPTGRTLYAIEGTDGMSAAIHRIDGLTADATRLDTGLTEVRYFDTIEVAPSNLRRLYVTGRAGAEFRPALYRSDDGQTLTRVPVASDADALWISGVDPRDPDTVYMRVSMGLGTELRRSRDGGMSFRRIATTSDPMLGFAISDDGRTIWIGSIESGLLRSDDGGDSFAPVNRLPIFCLRQHAGVLWACSDWETQPFALGRSRDQGRTFEPVLQLNNDAQFLGPPVCGARSEGAAICVERWPMMRRVFDDPGTALPDAGLADVPRDAPPLRDAGSDARAMDAATSRDGGVSRAPDTTCGCAVPGRKASSAWGAVFATLAVLRVARLRRRSVVRKSI